MRYAIITLLLLACFEAIAKKNLEKEATKIMAEGRLLYRSERASWLGSDVLMASGIEDLPNKVGGYFSYPDSIQTKCVFYTKDSVPEVFATVVFDETFSRKKIHFDMGNREFTETEQAYYDLAVTTRKLISADTFFSYYREMNLNIVPIIDKVKRVYVMTGTTAHQIPFGNDYLLTFDKNNKLKTKERIHNAYIPLEISDSTGSAWHTHLPKKSPFITPTDVCLLLLYKPFCKFSTYIVASEDYISLWSMEREYLMILTAKAFSRISKHQLKKDTSDGPGKEGLSK